ncbi:MAG TPA: BPL-N domain-containing protein [Rhabdochlamydiaceae bacterium]|nr:BPL-N domain-containing protein [Rhabdochlamydiaceae bacterium]
MTTALVYEDKGVCLQSANAVVGQLKSVLDPAVSVFKVDSLYLKTEPWEDNTAVLVMGGGSCSAWDEELGAEAIEKIHRYVMRGGRYIGLCAGAYFASAECRFRLMTKKRPLAFFPGLAIGPLVPMDDYLSLTAARAAEVCFKIRGFPQMGSVYYQGGCFFDIEGDTAAVEIMSTYRSLGKAAAVFCRVGKGCAFLDGTHPEFKWQASLSAGSDYYFKELVEKLSLQETFRQNIWKEIGIKMGFPLRKN